MKRDKRVGERESQKRAREKEREGKQNRACIFLLLAETNAEN